ncbi:MAG: Spy/CpxP family protein refolding chaperone [Gemmatimonadales bacterium]
MAHQGTMMHAMPLAREIQAFRPGALLERRERLSLTEQQVQRLTALQTELQATHERTRTEVQARMAEAHTAWQGGDSRAANAASQAVMQTLLAGHMAALHGATQARGVLTEEQRGRVQGWMDAGNARMHQMQMRRQQMQNRMNRGPRAPRRPPTRG